jgi:hypothetical protein
MARLGLRNRRTHTRKDGTSTGLLGSFRKGARNLWLRVRARCQTLRRQNSDHATWRSPADTTTQLQDTLTLKDGGTDMDAKNDDQLRGLHQTKIHQQTHASKAKPQKVKRSERRTPLDDFDLQATGGGFEQGYADALNQAAPGDDWRRVLKAAKRSSQLKDLVSDDDELARPGSSSASSRNAEYTQGFQTAVAELELERAKRETAEVVGRLSQAWRSRRRVELDDFD